VLLGYAVWAQAPSAPAPATNAPAGVDRATALTESQRAFIEENRSFLTFGLDGIPALQVGVMHRPLWQYLATLLYILIAFYVAKLVDWIIHSRLRKWAERTETQWDDILIGLLDGPVKVVVFVLLLNLGLQMFDWPPVVEGWFAKLTILAVGLSLALVVLKAVDAAITLWRRKLPPGGDREFNEHFLVLVGKVIKGIIIIVVVFTVFGSLGFDIRTALASVSIVGLALGLAAQDTVGNLFGAVAVFVDKPFKLGDRVRIGDLDGNVEEMGLRSTRIRNLDGFLVTVPNKELGNSRIVNISRRPTIRTTFGIGLTYDTPAPRVRRAVELIEEIFRKHPNTHDLVVHFNRFGDFALNIDVVYWCRLTDWKEFTRVFEALNLELKARFDEEGLSFAFPTQTLQLKAAASPGAPSESGPKERTR
jgi:MscS family membrane protein